MIGLTYNDLLNKLDRDLDAIAGGQLVEATVTAIRDNYVNTYVYDSHPGTGTLYDQKYGGRRHDLSGSGARQYNKVVSLGKPGSYQIVNTAEPNESVVGKDIPYGENLMQWINDGIIPPLSDKDDTYPWHRSGFLEATVSEVNKKKILCKAVKDGLVGLGYQKSSIKIK